MKKRYISLLFAIILTLSIFTIPAVAYESENELESYDVNNLVDENDMLEDESMNAEDSTNALRITMREFVRYDPSSNSINYKYISLGSVVGRNNTAYPMSISFIYQTSSSTTTTLGSSISVSATIDAVVATVSATAGVTATRSKSWTQGTSSGASLSLPGYATASISGYISGVTTAGSLVYYAYPDSSHSSGWYEYVSLPSSYIPINTVYLEAN